MHTFNPPPMISKGRPRNLDFTFIGRFVFPWPGLASSLSTFYIVAKEDLIGHFEEVVRK